MLVLGYSENYGDLDLEIKTDDIIAIRFKLYDERPEMRIGQRALELPRQPFFR